MEKHALFWPSEFTISSWNVAEEIHRPNRETSVFFRTCKCTHIYAVLVLHKNAGWPQSSIAGFQEDRTSDSKVDGSRCPTRFIFREKGKVCRAALRNGSGEVGCLFFVIYRVYILLLVSSNAFVGLTSRERETIVIRTYREKKVRVREDSRVESWWCADNSNRQLVTKTHIYIYSDRERDMEIFYLHFSRLIRRSHALFLSQTNWPQAARLQHVSVPRIFRALFSVFSIARMKCLFRLWRRALILYVRRSRRCRYLIDIIKIIIETMRGRP